MNDVTRLLSAIEQGDSRASEELLPLVYRELRRLAKQRLAKEKPGQTLQATALVHEAYLRLVGTDTAPHWNSRGHFFAAAAEAMRRILVNHARDRVAAKRGGGAEQVSLSLVDAPSGGPDVELIALEDALERLAALDPRKSRVVELKFFGGLTVEEIAEVLQVSGATVEREWSFARAWLYDAIEGMESAR